jgi:AcrR family transcriptional regulator
VPHQGRSRRNLSRLLDAAEAILGEKGADAATVPAIARRAGLSVGVVYRRFPDKEALLQEVYARFFERHQHQAAVVLRSDQVAGLRLATLARAVIAGLITGYRQNRGLLRAFLLYTRTHPDSKVRRHGQDVTRQVLPRLTEVMLLREDEIRHPDPRAAVRFGLTAVALAAQSIVLLEEPLPRAELPPGRTLEDELTRLFLGYLGVRASEADLAGAAREAPVAGPARPPAHR